MSGPITKDFWFCDCAQNNTHASEETYCERCCIYKEEGIDVFKEDIILMLNEGPADELVHTQQVKLVALPEFIEGWTNPNFIYGRG